MTSDGCASAGTNDAIRTGSPILQDLTGNKLHGPVGLVREQLRRLKQQRSKRLIMSPNHTLIFYPCPDFPSLTHDLI